jgi:hypothetical protein
MSDNLVQDTIIDYVLQNERDLKIALNIIYSSNFIKEKIVLKFLEALETKLRSDKIIDQNWIFKISENVFANYFNITLTKDDWENRGYYICLEAQSTGLKNFIIGITKKVDCMPIENGKLKKLLDQACGYGNNSNHWEWYQYVPSYRDWDNNEILFKLYKDKGAEPITLLASIILKIKEVAMPIIDRRMLIKIN